MTVNTALAFAASRIGYNASNDPKPGSEAGRWMAAKLGQSWLAGPSRSIWWCMCFCSQVVYEGGAGTLPGGPQFNTDTAVAAARREGRLVDPRSVIPGDLVIFRWAGANAGGATNHVGIVEKNLGSYVQTIEGNTSPGTAGSQSAGNGVWRRTRSWSVIPYAIRPYYGDGGSVTPAPAQPAASATSTGAVRGGLLSVDGWWGPAVTRKLQWAFKTPQDGVLSGQYSGNRKYYARLTPATVRYGSGGSTLVRAIQKYLGVSADGLLGQDTIKALQRRVGVTDDGYLGPVTVTAFQRRLNAGTF